MASFYCPWCESTFEIGFWKWIFTSPFHYFNFKEMRDYRRTKCPYCGIKTYMRRW